MLQVTEDSQIRSVEDALLRRFDGLIPRGDRACRGRGSRAHFRDARIRTYVPVLVQREAAGRLRKIPQTVG